jgi:hypothetical protein
LGLLLVWANADHLIGPPTIQSGEGTIAKENVTSRGEGLIDTFSSEQEQRKDGTIRSRPKGT